MPEALPSVATRPARRGTRRARPLRFEEAGSCGADGLRTGRCAGRPGRPGTHARPAPRGWSARSAGRQGLRPVRCRATTLPGADLRPSTLMDRRLIIDRPDGHGRQPAPAAAEAVDPAGAPDERPGHWARRWTGEREPSRGPAALLGAVLASRGASALPDKAPPTCYCCVGLTGVNQRLLTPGTGGSFTDVRRDPVPLVRPGRPRMWGVDAPDAPCVPPPQRHP